MILAWGNTHEHSKYVVEAVRRGAPNTLIGSGVNPGATDVAGDDIDQDCDGADAEAEDTGSTIPADTGSPGDTGGAIDGGLDDGKDDDCACGGGAAGMSLWFLGLAPVVARRRRQQG